MSFRKWKLCCLQVWLLRTSMWFEMQRTTCNNQTCELIEDEHFGQCDGITDHCMTGCAKGWFNITCLDPCSNKCQRNTCKFDDGKCSLGCVSGYIGEWSANFNSSESTTETTMEATAEATTEVTTEATVIIVIVAAVIGGIGIGVGCFIIKLAKRKVSTRNTVNVPQHALNDSANHTVYDIQGLSELLEDCTGGVYSTIRERESSNHSDQINEYSHIESCSNISQLDYITADYITAIASPELNEEHDTEMTLPNSEAPPLPSRTAENHSYEEIKNQCRNKRRYETLKTDACSSEIKIDPTDVLKDTSDVQTSTENVADDNISQTSNEEVKTSF